MVASLQSLGLVEPHGFLFLRLEGSRGALGSAFWELRLPSGSRLDYHRLGPPELAEPLSPLLPFLVTELKALPSKTRSALLRRAGFPPSWRRTVLGYVDTGEAHRDDEFFYASAGLKFDQDTLLDALGRLLLLLARRSEQGPLVLVWEDFQNASQALLAWTLRFLSRPLPGLILAIAFRGRVTTGGLDSDLWTPVLTAAEQRGGLHRYTTEETLGALVGPNPGDEEILRYARTARVLLALEDALRYYQELERRGYDADGPLLPLETGEVLLLLNRVNQASLPLNQALERARRLRKKPLQVRTLTLLCYLKFLENDLTQARKYWRLAADKDARTTRDRTWYDLRVLRLVVNQSILDNSWFGPEFEELRTFYRERAEFSTLNYLEGLVPYYRLRVVESGWEASRDEALAVRERIRRSGNRYWDSVLLHCLGFIHEHVGLKPEARTWFRRAVAARQRLGDPVELIKVYNGAGYFHFTIGDFAPAARYYRLSLTLLEQVRDFPEICLTLFNMTLIYFFSGSFSRALEFLHAILEIMDALGLEVLPWHRKAKLFALAGVCALRTGQLSLALEYSDRARVEPLDSDAEPYLLLLDLLVNGKQQPALARERFERTLALVQAENHVYFRIHVLAEQAEFLGLPEGQTSLEEGLALARARGLVNQERLLLRLSEGASLGALGVKIDRLPERTLTLIAGLRSSARQEASSRLLLEKVHEMSFLRHFQTQVTSEQDFDTLFRRVFDLVRAQYPFHAGAVWRSVGAATVLVQGFGHLQNRVDRQFSYRFKTGATSLWITLETEAEDRPLSSEQQRILTMAFQHLDLVLKLLAAQETLRRAATRDHLTGLYSRQELLERIEAERRRTLRHANRGERTLALLFLDLDHFKTYNDTLGHAAGDAALQRFAQLVLSEVRTIDVLGRYGGDEFLLLLPETGEAGARATATRILEAVSAKLEKPLGCSVGIAVLPPSATTDVPTLISQADAALYRTKTNQKGTYTVYG